MKNGFSDAVIGLSGGIDSSLVATVAVDALGAEPRPRSDHALSLLERGLDHRRGRARRQPRHRGDRTFRSSLSTASSRLNLARVLGSEPAGLTDENLQSRLRGVLLMALSNANGWIVLTTGNKSEMATGYSTLYGDSAGGFAVIKDVAKTLVYELCLHRNKIAGFDLVPEADADQSTLGRAAARPARRGIAPALSGPRPGDRGTTSRATGPPTI